MIKKFIKKYKLPSYRETQFNKHFYQELVNSFDKFSTWSKKLREKLSKEVDFSTLDIERELISKDAKTIKVLFKRKNGEKMIETVLMRFRDKRNTVCVSCMVGCPVNCTFCATGKMGFHGNLSAHEIIDQVLYFQRLLKKENEKVTNVVFMGMGEPLLNLDAILESIDILTDPERMGFSQRRLTVSTSGYIPQLKQLINSGFRGRIAISLHAPNQRLRAELMPVAKLYPLDKLLEVLDEYTTLTNKRITYEYILIENVNDKVEHANELAKCFKGKLVHINLIPYNPVPGVSFKRPSKSRIEDFEDVLEAAKINYTTRVTMGDDVNAACGQLIYKSQNPN